MINFLKKYKAEILVGTGALLAGVLSFFITLSVYPKTKVQVPEKIKEQTIVRETNIMEEEKPKIEIALGEPQNEMVSESQSKIENSEEQLGKIHENLEIVDTENINGEVPDEAMQEIVVARNEEKEEHEVKEAISKDAEVTIDFPISGDIILEFAKDKLVYSETLEEWITHDGTDIKGEVAEPVKAVLAGTVESVKMDPRYGNTIIIKHNDNLKTVYANLSTLDLVYAGKKVEKGEIISGIGEGFGFESKEGPHVHFEIVENGVVREP